VVTRMLDAGPERNSGSADSGVERVRSLPLQVTNEVTRTADTRAGRAPRNKAITQGARESGERRRSYATKVPLWSSVNGPQAGG
jgi:hypothetical protein